MTPELLIDVTQYASWPATSGVQRVLMHLVRGWPDDAIDARYGLLTEKGTRYLTGPVEALAAVMDAAFHADPARPVTAQAVRSELEAAADGSERVSRVQRKFERYLLPEPTLRRESLGVASQWVRADAARAFFVYYDALPLTHPQFYPPGADAGGIVTRYHAVVAAAENVCCISQLSGRTLEDRLARRRLRNTIVVHPGADALQRVPARPPARPTFTVLGTIEPRKRHRLVLHAFELLWAEGCDYRLVLLGSWGWEHPDLRARLRKLESQGRVEWVEAGGDDGVAETLARSTAVIFTPDAEGFGLPLVEALAAGCPVVTSTGIPALEDLPDAGQIRLDAADPASLARAVTTLADPAANDAYRAAIATLDLPTWKQFASDVASWVSGSNGARRTT